MAEVYSRRVTGFAKFLAVVAIIGAVNWGLIGFFNWNLVDAIFGGTVSAPHSALSRLIYAIVGLAGLALAIVFPWSSRHKVESDNRVGMGRRADVRP